MGYASLISYPLELWMSYMRGSRSGGFKVKIELPQAFRRTDIHPHSPIVFTSDLSRYHRLDQPGRELCGQARRDIPKNLGR